jgi:hypothetical protein
LYYTAGENGGEEVKEVKEVEEVKDLDRSDEFAGG